MASESINDFAIKLGVDATGVATGMAAANAVILQSQREIAKAEAVEREINLQETLKNIEAKDKALEKASQKHRQRLEEDARRFAAGAGRGDMQSMTVGGRIPVSEASMRTLRAYVDEVEEANRLEREAIGLKRQLMTAEQLHTARLAEYDAMLARNIITQQEHADAIAYSTRIAQASAGGFGGAGAAITQASYAAEDFIQVLSMGGGLNMALMSASNNLSMVVRSVLGANAAMGAIAGFGVPALLIGLGMLVRYLSTTESRFDSLTEAFDELNAAAKRLAELETIRIDAEIRLSDITRMTDVEDIQSEIDDSDKELKRLNREAALLLKEQERLAAHAREIFYGGEEGTFVNFMAKLQQDANKFNQAGFEDAAADIERRIAGMQAVKAELDEALKEGNINDIERLSTELTRLMEASSVGMQGQEVADLLGIMGSMQEILADEEALRALGEKLIEQGHERAKVEETINAVIAERQKLTEQLAYAEEQAAGQATRERQQRMREELDYMRMSEAEREMKRLRDEQAAFAGIDTAFTGPQLPINEEAFAQEFMNQQLEQVQKEIDQLRKPGYAQGLEQNTYDAQAKAFEQMFKARFGPADAQVERLDTLIEIQRQLVEQGAQAPRIQVAPGG